MESEKTKQQLYDGISISEYGSGLKVGTDSVLLARFAGVGKDRIGVELGCGSGIISIMILHENRAKAMTGFEIQHEYALLSNENASECGLGTRFRCIKEDIRNIRTCFQRGRADFVVCNPPYFPEGSGKKSDNDKSDIARRETSGTIYDFCVAASFCLKNGGKFYVVFRPERLCTLIDAMKSACIEPKIIRYKMNALKPSLVILEGVKGGSEGVRIEFID